MPTRFFLLHSFIGPVLIILIFFSMIKNIENLKKFTFMRHIILVILIFHSFLNYDKFQDRISNFKNNIKVSNDTSKLKFWNELKKLDTSQGSILTTNVETCDKTLRISNKPILICIEAIDFIPYLPNLITPTKNIITEVYGVDFFNPPQKNRGGIVSDNFFREKFENRNLEEWGIIAKNYKLSGIIVLKSWNMKLKPLLIGKKYVYYSF